MMEMREWLLHLWLCSDAAFHAVFSRLLDFSASPAMSLASVALWGRNGPSEGWDYWVCVLCGL